jgi:spermidine/putrescine transport system substrate-binding protein
MTNRNLPAFPRSASGIDRRDFLIRAALLSIGGPALLAACGGGSSLPSGSADGKSEGVASTGKKVSIAAWPFYIENDQAPLEAATIANFIKATGIDVDYQIAIDDNVSFTAKFEGDLKAGKGIGFDIAQPTSWMASKWVSNGWVEEIPADLVPNKKNLVDAMASPAWDPTRAKSMPYSIIQTGIAYYPEKVGFEITSIKDFFKPELKGKITILSEMRDAVGFMLLSMGIKPADAKIEEMLRACEELKKLRDAGQFRKITGNGYIEDLGAGETAAAMAWSGDVAGIQADTPDLKWVLPTEGGILSTDTLIIPKGGNIETAAAWINYLYDPKVSGPLFEAISYGSPVKGAGDFMTEAGKGSSLVNPAADAPIYEWRDLTDAEQTQVDDAFVAATQQ